MDHATSSSYKNSSSADDDSEHYSRPSSQPPPDVLYGHVHIAKTAGTTVNGELAMHYERVCGHKGYSYDAFQTNELLKKGSPNILYNNADSKSYNRGRVPPQ